MNCGKFGEEFNYYDTGFICDIISEIADSNIAIYWADIFEYAKENTSDIEDALMEFGEPKDAAGHIDFMRIMQQGQFLTNERDLYDNLSDSLKNFAYSYIEFVIGKNEITEEQNENLLNGFDFSDNNERLENLIDHIKTIFE